MNVIEKRRSIRKYTDQPVKEEQIRSLVKAAMSAPSGHNTQPWHFIVIDDALLKKAVAQTAHKQDWMLGAPVFIACVADIRVRIDDEKELFLDEESPQFELKQIIRDTAICIDHLVLEAEEQGLGTCWVAWFKQAEMRSVLGVPDDKFVVAIVTVGHAAEEPRPRPRKKMEEVLHFNTW